MLSQVKVNNIREARHYLYFKVITIQMAIMKEHQIHTFIWKDTLTTTVTEKSNYNY